MSALAILPLLEFAGLTSAVAEGSTFILGETIGSFAAKATTGIIAGEIAAPIDKAALNFVNENVKPLVSDYFQFGSALLSDPTSLANKVSKAKEKKLNKPLKDTQSISKKSQKTVTFDLSADASSDVQTFTYSISDSGGENSLLVPIVQLPAQNTISDTGEEVVNQNQKIPRGIDVFDQKECSPRDLARLVIDISKQLALTGDPKTATNNVIQMNPTSLTLVQKVSQYMAKKSIPSSEEYKKIARVFNGRNIDYSSFSIRVNPKTMLIEVTGVNEIGQAQTMPENTGFVLPSVSGTIFMGACSKNDRLPTNGRVEDYFSFFHDYSWRNGNFNRQGDLQFISRLSQNLDRVRPENLSLVHSTIIYFSNVSLNLSMLVDQPREDIFEFIGNVEETQYQDPNYNLQRSQFYSSMSDELNNYTRTDGFLIDQAKNPSLNIQFN